MHFLKSLQESKLAMTMRPVSIELKLTVIPYYVELPLQLLIPCRK